MVGRTKRVRRRYFACLGDRVAVAAAAERLRAVGGVRDLDADLAHGTLTVEYDADDTLVGRVHKVIAAAGLLSHPRPQVESRWRLGGC